MIPGLWRFFSEKTINNRLCFSLIEIPKTINVFSSELIGVFKSSSYVFGFQWRVHYFSMHQVLIGSICKTYKFSIMPRLPILSTNVAKRCFPLFFSALSIAKFLEWQGLDSIPTLLEDSSVAMESVQNLG